MTLSFTYDTRDSSFLTRKGTRIDLSAYVAGGPLGGDVQIYGFDLDAAQYFHLPYDTILLLNGEIGSVANWNGGEASFRSLIAFIWAAPVLFVDSNSVMLDQRTTKETLLVVTPWSGSPWNTRFRLLSESGRRFSMTVVSWILVPGTSAPKGCQVPREDFRADSTRISVLEFAWIYQSGHCGLIMVSRSRKTALAVKAGNSSLVSGTNFERKLFRLVSP